MIIQTLHIYICCMYPLSPPQFLSFGFIYFVCAVIQRESHIICTNLSNYFDTIFDYAKMMHVHERNAYSFAIFYLYASRCVRGLVLDKKRRTDVHIISKHSKINSLRFYFLFLFFRFLINCMRRGFSIQMVLLYGKKDKRYTNMFTNFSPSIKF